ncbi:PREDICTED: uncharacterized protein LOC109179025 [Ipomoea nil]|uniref:uncharacterized protein LOC109179025 n=1 Tax=Ipomoea nil TaxID=35883 RepID=UPI0009014AE2|nr:PREDICTED: uncharacterized protein LOC109179025 [Ipomoea nil]
MGTVKFSLNLLVDPKCHRVLFAEAENDFVDFLLSLLSMPLGTITNLLSSEAMIGSIGNIYHSIENIDGAYMLSNESKIQVLTTRKDKISARNFYTCQSHRIVSIKYGENCPRYSFCGTSMTKEITYVGYGNVCARGYVQGLVTYMVTDDLSTTPMSAITGISVLKKFKASKFDALEERVVEFTIPDVELEFLEASLKSKEVLTDVFLRKQWPFTVGGTPATGKGIALKLLVDTRADKVLFAEARKDFVDFLCHLLLLPLGNVIKKLTTSVPEKSMVGCIGNVYQSYKNLAKDYMLPNKIKDTLLNPDVAKVVCSVPLLWSNNSGSAYPKKLYGCTNSYDRYFTDECGYPCPSCRNPMKESVESCISDDEKSYVKGLARYMVTDDLCITPLSMVSCIPVLNMWSAEHPAKLNGKVVEFGVEEALKLLKACLRGKMALSDVFLVKDEVNNLRNHQ